MFDSLSDRFDGIFKKLRGRGQLTEKDIDEVAREIRLALLEADVNVRVVKRFIARVKERADGAEVAKSLSPAQQVIKIVHEELVEALGGTTGKLTISSQPPTVVMLSGLQGSGKTTAAGKLGALPEDAGQAGAARRRGPPTTRRGRAAPRARAAHRRPGVLGADATRVDRGARRHRRGGSPARDATS